MNDAVTLENIHTTTVENLLMTPILGIAVNTIPGVQELERERFNSTKWNVARDAVGTLLESTTEQPPSGLKQISPRERVSEFSSVEIAACIAIAESHAANEIRKLEEQTRKSLTSEAELWKTDETKSIKTSRDSFIELKARYSTNIAKIKEDLDKNNTRLAGLEEEAQNQSSASFKEAKSAYNNKQKELIAALQEEVRQMKKDMSLVKIGIDSSARSGDDLKKINNTLKSEPARLRQSLTAELSHYAGAETCASLVNAIYTQAEALIHNYEANKQLVDYVRNHMGNLVDYDFDADIFRTDGWHPNLQYSEAQKELLSLGITALILRSDKDDVIPPGLLPKVQELRAQVRDTVVKQIKDQRMEKGEWKRIKEKEKELEARHVSETLNLKDTHTQLEELAKRENELDAKVREYIKKGMNLLYAKLYSDDALLFHKPEESNAAQFARWMAVQYLKWKSDAQSLPHENINLPALNAQMDDIRRQITDCLFPQTDQSLKNTIFEFMKPSGSKNHVIHDYDWSVHQIGVLNRMLGGEHFACYDRQTTAASFIETIGLLINRSEKKEFDLVLGENPETGETWASKMTSRSIRLKEEGEDYEIISLPYEPTNEYCHFILSKSKKKVVSIELSKDLDSERKQISVQEQGDPTTYYDNMFMSFIFDTADVGRIGGGAHRMFIFEKTNQN